MVLFTGALDTGKSEIEKTKNLTDNQNNVFLLADGNGLIKIYHSPKDFGGTLLHPSHKVSCLTRLSCLAICVQLYLMSAIVVCNINTPTFTEIAACQTAQDIQDLIDDGLFSCEGSNIVRPVPWLRDTLINAESLRPFELIPIVITAARAYNDAHPDIADANKDIVHVDDFCLWAWGVGVRQVPES